VYLRLVVYSRVFLHRVRVVVYVHVFVYSRGIHARSSSPCSRGGLRTCVCVLAWCSRMFFRHRIRVVFTHVFSSPYSRGVHVCFFVTVFAWCSRMFFQRGGLRTHSCVFACFSSPYSHGGSRRCICVFVGLWACGFVGLWVCGFVGLWVCGFVGFSSPYSSYNSYIRFLTFLYYSYSTTAAAAAAVSAPSALVLGFVCHVFIRVGRIFTCLGPAASSTVVYLWRQGRCATVTTISLSLACLA